MGEQFRDNFTTHPAKLGKYVADTTWRDSVTGEYYINYVASYIATVQILERVNDAHLAVTY